MKRLFCLLPLLLPAIWIHAQDADAKKPNILLFVADDLSYHDHGCYGNEQVRTPNIDGLARDGLRFENCFNSAPMCAPTRMSLYSGIHPVRNGAHPNHSRVYPWVKSMPHYLGPLSYRVALLGKRHFKPTENFPFEFLGGRHHDNGNGLDLDTAKVEAFIKETGEKPWCLVVTSNQPHTPWNRGDASAYDPAALKLPPYMVDTPETRRALTRYYGEIAYMDGQMGACLKALEETGAAGETIVIYLSEQGSNFPHCKWTCYDTGLRSAAIVRWPGIVDAGGETDAMIQYVDVLPTLLEIAGGEPEGHDFDGRSFLPVLKGEADSHRDYSYGVQTSRGIHNGPEAYGIRSIRGDRYRLIWNVNSDNAFENNVTHHFRPFRTWREKAEAGDAFAKEQVERYITRPEFELYDLREDPFEMRNLAHLEGHKALRDDLHQRLRNWMAQQGDVGAATELEARERQ